MRGLCRKLEFKCTGKSLLEYGFVGINEVGLASGEVPFGGVKMSGIGCEGGSQGIEDYVETKYILMSGLDK